MKKDLSWDRIYWEEEGQKGNYELIGGIDELV